MQPRTIAPGVLQMTARMRVVWFCLPWQQKQGWFRNSMPKTHGTRPCAKGAPQCTSSACPAPSERPGLAPAASAACHRKGHCSVAFPWRLSQCIIEAFLLGPPSQSRTSPIATAFEDQRHLAIKLFDGLLRQLEWSWPASFTCTLSLIWRRFTLPIEPTGTHLWLCRLI